MSSGACNGSRTCVDGATRTLPSAHRSNCSYVDQVQYNAVPHTVPNCTLLWGSTVLYSTVL